MPTGKSKTEEAEINDPGEPTTETASTKARRMHVWPAGSIPREVVRTFFDSERNVVKDVVIVPKVVKDRNGKDVEVTIQRVVTCRNEALQKKYCRSAETTNIIEIEEIE